MAIQIGGAGNPESRRGQDRRSNGHEGETDGDRDARGRHGSQVAKDRGSGLGDLHEPARDDAAAAAIA